MGMPWKDIGAQRVTRLGLGDDLGLARTRARNHFNVGVHAPDRGLLRRGVCRHAHYRAPWLGHKPAEGMRMANGIYCFEGDWGKSRAPGRDVRPILDALKAWDETPYEHHGVGTKRELEHRLEGWKRRTSFRVGYLATHGTTRTIDLGADELHLDELAASIAGRAEGRVLLFSGCSVLTAPEAVLKQFCLDAGLAAVAGYTRQVDFVDGMAFEMLVLRELAASERFKSTYARILRRHPDWCARLGFRMATPTWASASPRRGRPPKADA